VKVLDRRRRLVVGRVGVALLGLGIIGIAPAAATARSVVLSGSDATYRWGSFDTPTHGDTNIRASPTSVGNLSDIVAIAAGNASNMALDSSGDVWTWGDGVNGVLGDGSLDDHVSNAVEVSGLPTIVAMGEADDTDVAIAANGDVWGWGRNESGQLCTGDRAQHESPVQLTNLSGVVAAAGGGTHMTYLLSNGKMVACGGNGDGELGDGNFTDRTRPVTVTGLPSSPIKAITAGPSTSTALLTNGQVWNWGNDNFGQLGDGSTLSSPVPVRAALPSAATEVYAGGDDENNGQSLALLKNGQVWGWGNDAQGQLGNGAMRQVDRRPVRSSALPSGVTFVYVATGAVHSLGLDSAGNVWAWGSNGDGQVGSPGSGASVLTPVEVLSGVTMISATANDSVAHMG